MPLYLDLHKIQNEAKEGFNLTPEGIPLKDNHGYRCLHSWIDLEKNYVVSILDAPNEFEIKSKLKAKTGIGSHQIFPVKSEVAEVFLNRFYTNGNRQGKDKTRFRILKDEEVVKVLLVVATTDLNLLRYQMGDENFFFFHRNCKEIFKELLQRFEGKQFSYPENLCVASFISVFNALNCALTIKSKLSAVNNSVKVRLGLICTSTEKPAPPAELQFHSRVNSEIVVASRVKEMCGATSEKLKETEPNLYWLKNAEEKILRSLLQVLNQNWQKPNFNCREFRSKISMSKASLYRKCIAITGKSPNSLIKEYRLLQALRLLKTGQSITRTCYDTGFNSPSYFSRCFHKHFKIQPGCYRGLCEI